MTTASQSGPHASGFSQDWLSLQQPHLVRVLRTLRGDPHGLEIGAFEGRSALWFLTHFLEQLDIIEPFTGNPEIPFTPPEDLEKRLIANLAPVAGRYTLHKGLSVDVLPGLVAAGRRFDFVYVDGSHHSKDVILDAVLGFAALRPGGIMVFDDYLWRQNQEPHANPWPAIDFFTLAYAGELEIVEAGYQVSIRRLR